jgi:hypothetical protein
MGIPLFSDYCLQRMGIPFQQITPEWVTLFDCNRLPCIQAGKPGTSTDTSPIKVLFPSSIEMIIDAMFSDCLTVWFTLALRNPLER